MKNQLFQKQHPAAFLLVVCLLLGSYCNILAQTVGDYRSVNTGAWSALTTWERLNALPGTWATPTSSQGYPGQMTTPGAVEIRQDHDVLLDVNPANSVGTITITSTDINKITSVLTIGSQTLRCTTLSINGGNGQRYSEVGIGTGTLVVTGNITTSTPLNGRNRLSFSGAGLLQVGGSVIGGMEFTASTGTVEYTGTVAQDVADYAYNVLKVSGTGTKSLTANMTPSKLSQLVIAAGVLDTKTYSLTGTASLTMTGGTLKLAYISGVNNSMPEITGTYSLTGGAIELSGAGAQQLRGAKTYNSLTFSGSGVKTLSSAPTAINGTVTIAEVAILDVENNSFGGTTTNFTMTGGRFRSSKLSDAQPQMDGTYALTGGVVELYGSTAAQQQTLRGGKTYYAIELNAAAANTTAGNILQGSGSILVSNQFRIASPAIYRIGGAAAVEGSGSFVMDNGSGLFYGDEKGITLAACGTGTTCGNIRTSNRTFPSSATYGFVGASANMVSGSGLPASITNLYVNRSVDVTLSNALTVTGTLGFTAGKVTLANNNLTASGNITGADASKYVITNSAKSATSGFLIRPIGTAAVSFPIGSATSYSPLSMTNATSVNVKARVFDGVYSNGAGASLVSDIEEVVKSTWDIAAVSGTPTPAIEFQWNSSYEGSRFTISRNANVNNPKVSANANGADTKWTPITSLAVGGSGPYSITATGVPLSTYSKFTILGDPTVALPVHLLSFTGKLVNKTAYLEWLTTNEKGNLGFEIEKSSDAAHFVKIGFIKADTQRNTFHQYGFTDEKTVAGGYYRLKQVDEDGRFEYSKIVYVPVASVVSFYPNPTDGRVQIGLANGEEAEVQLLSMEGVVLFDGKASALQLSEKLSETVQNLQPGIYLIQSTQGSTIFRSKLIRR